MLINVKIPTIVGILTFMSRINFVLSCVEHEKKITSGPGLILSNVKLKPMFKQHAQESQDLKMEFCSFDNGFKQLCI